MTEMITGCNL